MVFSKVEAQSQHHASRDSQSRSTFGPFGVQQGSQYLGGLEGILSGFEWYFGF